MAKKSGKDYKGFGRVVSLVLAIFPVTAWIAGIITRAKEGKVIAAIIRAVFGFNLIWLLDLILMISKGRILRVL